ncbi:MAG TPA: tRNA 2-thiouridine(34) synthase MnmA [Acidimicrobiales bacterium]|jgi:tRNA-specific 2-thiouridylase|nr:tRNA 2-thiouridine(34) synthase MnmA [Acidimicrobiales bacterium]
MRVLAAMSGGVDSSVAAALLVEEGHDVVGVTLRLWENTGDSGCCSVAEIDDARSVATALGIDHLVWTFVDDFDAQVVAPYVAAHAQGLTPNPCIECNRHLKFGRLLRRAVTLGFDAVATGHHARTVTDVDGRHRLLRGADAAKDQSYVLYVLGQDELARCRFPVGSMTKADVRAKAAALGLATADKPDSQDVCFVTTSGGRHALLGSRIPLHPGRVLDRAGAEVGRVDAVELVTVGQRRGLGGGGGTRRYALDVDPATSTVVVGDAADLLAAEVSLDRLCWVHGPVAGPVEAQTSAHGTPVDAEYADGVVRFAEPRPRVAPGQSVVLYRGDEVLGGGVALRAGPR